METKKIITGLVILALIPSVSADDWLDFNPTHPLYGFQRFYEGIEYAMCLDDNSRAYVALKHIEKQSKKIELMEEEEEIEALQEDLEERIERVKNLGYKISELAKRKEFEEKLEVALNHHVEVLESKGIDSEKTNRVRALVSANLVGTMKEIIEEEESEGEIIATMEDKISRFCRLVDVDRIPKDFDEIVKVEIWDDGEIIWERTFEGRYGFVDCNSDAEPSIRVLFELDLVEEYYKKYEKGEEITSKGLIREVMSGRVKVTPIHKLYTLWRKYRSESEEILEAIQKT